MLRHMRPHSRPLQKVAISSRPYRRVAAAATIIVLEPTDILPSFLDALAHYGCATSAAATADCVSSLLVPPPLEQQKILATLADVSAHVPDAEAILGPIFRLLMQGDQESCQKIIDAYLKYLTALAKLTAATDGV